MDGIAQMIVDILRRKEEEKALGAGQLPPQQATGHVPPAGMGPRGIAPKHGGKTYDQIVAEMGG